MSQNALLAGHVQAAESYNALEEKTDKAAYKHYARETKSKLPSIPTKSCNWSPDRYNSHTICMHTDALGADIVLSSDYLGIDSRYTDSGKQSLPHVTISFAKQHVESSFQADGVLRAAITTQRKPGCYGTCCCTDNSRTSCA